MKKLDFPFIMSPFFCYPLSRNDLLPEMRQTAWKKMKMDGKMKTLKKEELKEMGESGDDFLLANVLTEKQFQQEHIPGSVNIPVTVENFAERFLNEAGSKDRKIVVYCASFECQASSKAARKLEAAGFTDVYDFEGGMKEWKEGGYPTESS